MGYVARSTKKTEDKEAQIVIDCKTETKRDEEYLNLEIKKKNIQDQTIDWIAKATTLHGNSLAEDEKAEVLALKASFVAELSKTLGI